MSWSDDVMIWWFDDESVMKLQSNIQTAQTCPHQNVLVLLVTDVRTQRVNWVWFGLIRFDSVWLGLIGFDSASSSTDELLRPTPRHNLITDQCALTGSFSIPSRIARPVRPVKSYCILIICYPDQHRASTGPAPGQRLRIQRPNSP